MIARTNAAPREPRPTAGVATRGRAWSALGMLAALALVLGACAPAAPAAPTPAPAAQAPAAQGQPAAQAPAAAPAQVQAAAPAGSAKPLVIGIRQTGENYDMTSILPSEIMAVSGNVHEYLLARNTKNELVPGLAESWTVSPDGKVVDFTLRKGVKFHSGDPMTAADVAFAWDRIVANKLQPSISAALDTVEAVDATHVRATFKAPDVAFLPVLGLPVVSKAYHDRVGEQEFVAHPVGTGPYQFVKLQKGEYVDLAAFPDYWGPKPQVQQVRFRFVTEDTTRVAMLKTGEADIVMQVPYALVADVEKTPGLRVVRQNPGPISSFLTFQFVNPQTPWANQKVRLAMAEAIDRDAIVKDLFAGVPTGYAGLAPGDLGYDPDLKPYSYDPENAKKLLAEAGYPNGFDYKLYYMTGAAAGMKETAEADSLYLSKVGIKSELVPYEGPKFIEFAMKASGKPDQDYAVLLIGSLAGKPEPTVGLVRQFAKIFPMSRYFNDDVNGLVLKASATTDTAQRAELIKESMRKVHEDVAYIPMWTSANVYGLRDNVDFALTIGDTELMYVKDVALKR